MNPGATPFQFGAAILAAGRSRRMGQPKMLLPWAGSTILGSVVKTWRELGAAQTVVVCASEDLALHAELDRLSFPLGARIVNSAPERGMFSSVQCAARWPSWSPALTHFAIVLGDQPHLCRETLLAIVRFNAAHPTSICQPACRGHPRHPVFLPKADFLDLGNTPHETLKAFLQQRLVALCHLDDPGLDLDLDHPEDYAQALRLAQ